MAFYSRITILASVSSASNSFRMEQNSSMARLYSSRVPPETLISLMSYGRARARMYMCKERGRGGKYTFARCARCESFSDWYRDRETKFPPRYALHAPRRRKRQTAKRTLLILIAESVQNERRSLRRLTRISREREISCEFSLIGEKIETERVALP